MRGNIRLGRLAGIEVALHYSWFLIALLLTLSLGASFGSKQGGFSARPLLVWSVAALTGVLFFGTLVLHELAHALAARAARLPVRSITLFALGGVSHIQGEPDRPRTELWIGIVGPLTSLVIGLACLGLARALGWTATAPAQTPLTVVLVWLGTVNLLLAAFNMLPGYPLDGGRVLRAALWKLTGSRRRATRIAASVGQAVAIGLIALGVVQFFTAAGVAGLWLAFIGWFLLAAASASSHAVDVYEFLGGVSVGEVMSREYASVDGQLSQRTLVDEELMRNGRRFFVVENVDGRAAGLVTPREVTSVPRREWPNTRVADVMKPLESLRSVAPRDSLGESLDLMSREEVHQLPVVEDARLAGVLTRGDILRVLRTRRELAA
jgi:Zn-dependent protease